jgi:hypothetical protein
MLIPLPAISESMLKSMPVEQVPPFCETLWAAVVFSFAVLSEACEYCYAEGKSLSSTIDVRVLKVYGLCLAFK